MRRVEQATIILLSIGVVSGLLILIDYVASQHLISRDQAFAIAVKTGNWSENFLADKTLDMKLLHTKNSKFAFIVDEKTLNDIMPFCPQNKHCIEPYEINRHGLQGEQYIWIVTVQGQPPNILSNNEWGYMIDAKSGQVLN